MAVCVGFCPTQPSLFEVVLCCNIQWLLFVLCCCCAALRCNFQFLLFVVCARSPRVYDPGGCDSSPWLGLLLLLLLRLWSCKWPWPAGGSVSNCVGCNLAKGICLPLTVRSSGLYRPSNEWVRAAGGWWCCYPVLPSLRVGPAALLALTA